MILYGKEQVQPWNLEFSSNLYWGLKQSDVGERYIQTVGTTKRKTKRVHGLISPSWVIVSSMRMKSSVIMHTLTSVCCRYSESLGSLWQLNVKLNRSTFLWFTWTFRNLTGIYSIRKWHFSERSVIFVLAWYFLYNSCTNTYSAQEFVGRVSLFSTLQ